MALGRNAHARATTAWLRRKTRSLVRGTTPHSAARWPAALRVILLSPPHAAIFILNMISLHSSGLKVPEGSDRRELYKSQYRAIYTYKMSAAELDQAFREAVTGDGPDGGWSIKNDERVKYVGKLEVAKGEEQQLKVTMEDYPEAGMSALKYYTIQSYTK
mmetsp:Transcript_21745/g.55492  ORF Transcript_21745/g.55492 Transcript_21745/m.55492 type:complete len:160 (+) Transcript_21745:14-493(+)